MNCSECIRPAESICSCQFLLFCAVHKTSHCLGSGYHSVEYLDISLSSHESQALRDEISSRINALQHSIRNISLFSKQTIKKIKNCSHVAIKKLETQVQFYVNLSCLKKLSNSLKLETDKLVSSVLITKDISVDIGSVIEKIFSDEFVTSISLRESEVKNKSKKRLKEEAEKQRLNEEMLKKQVREIEKIEELKQECRGKIFVKNEKKNKPESSSCEIKHVVRGEVILENNHDKRKYSLRSGYYDIKRGNLQGKFIIDNNEDKTLSPNLCVDELPLDIKKKQLKTSGLIFNQDILNRMEEIMLSNSGKFAFICKFYVGKFK